MRVVPHATNPLSPATVPVVHAPGAPHDPFTTHAALLNVHGAFVPPPEPLHVHERVVPHDVNPLSPATVPVVHAPGAPHDPFTTHAALLYVHDAFVPPPDPLQFQVRVVPHDVNPLSPATEPAVHAPGAPHAPLTAAEQELSGPPPVTAKAV